MHITQRKVEFFSNLTVGNIESHQIQAGNPNLKGLMMTAEDGVGQVIEIAVTMPALVVLTVSLHGIMPVLFDMLRSQWGQRTNPSGQRFSRIISKQVALLISSEILPMFTVETTIHGGWMKCSPTVWNPIRAFLVLFI